MARKTSQSISTWVLWHPFKFALISFVLIMLVAILLGLFGVASGAPMTIGVIASMICAAFLTFRKMPIKNMDQRGFVALNNIQMIVVTTAFLISAILVSTYQNEITAKLIILSTLKQTMFTALIIIVGLFYMYLCGLFVTNLYAKYIRCRAMGISPWKIICTMPFGFGLLWTPGYLISDDTKHDSAVTIKSKWYSKFTNWIISSTPYTVLAFAVTTIYSGFFYSFNMSILTMVAALLFAIWYRIVGRTTFNRQKNNKYAYFAIVINIVILITLAIWYGTLLTDTANIALNISDIAPVAIQ